MLAEIVQIVPQLHQRGREEDGQRVRRHAALVRVVQAVVTEELLQDEAQRPQEWQLGEEDLRDEAGRIDASVV